MAPESISAAYFINLSYQFVRLCIPPIVVTQRLGKMYPPFIARQRLGNHVPAGTDTRKNGRIVWRVCLWVCLCTSLSLLVYNSVKTFPRQWRIVGHVVFAVHVVSEESRLSFLQSFFFCSRLDSSGHCYEGINTFMWMGTVWKYQLCFPLTSVSVTTWTEIRSLLLTRVHCHWSRINLWAFVHLNCNWALISPTGLGRQQWNSGDIVRHGSFFSSQWTMKWII